MTNEEAQARVKEMGGNIAIYHPETIISLPYYRVAKIHMVGFEWEGIGDTWEEAFENIERMEDL